MKAVILVGGFGTRLRPLTFSKPKPLVPFVNKPIVVHQIKALVEVGVSEIILAVGHMPGQMIEFMKGVEEEYKIKITFSVEEVPLGTAGPLILAKQTLLGDKEPFFMLNSDVTCEFPLKEMLNFHRRHNREGTILVTPVENPSKYGLVVFNKDGLISEFLEKPQHETKDLPSNSINAGIYLLNKSVLNRLPDTPKNVSIERQVFPAMTLDKDLYAMNLPGYWMDIGQPQDFIGGTRLHLQMVCKRFPQLLADSKENDCDLTVQGNVLIDPSAKIGKGCSFGPDVVIGPNCTIGDGVRISNSSIFEGTKIESHARVSGCIVGWNSTIRQWAHLDKCYLGADVDVGSEVVMIGATVCPHKGLKDSCFEPKVHM